jgi:hypothetical protein
MNYRQALTLVGVVITVQRMNGLSDRESDPLIRTNRVRRSKNENRLKSNRSTMTKLDEKGATGLMEREGRHPGSKSHRVDLPRDKPMPVFLQLEAAATMCNSTVGKHPEERPLATVLFLHIFKAAGSTTRNTLKVSVSIF